MSNSKTKPARTPTGDLVLQEVWRSKDELSAAHGHNVHRLFTEARERQRRSSRASHRSSGMLTVIVGLPGAGKSTLLNQLEHGFKPHDFHANAVDNSPAVEKSRHFSELIARLRAGEDCGIADIAFCDAARRSDLEATVHSKVPSVRIEWIFFENDRAKCERNIRFRNRAGLENDLEALREWAPRYTIPTNVKPRPIWTPREDLAPVG